MHISLLFLILILTPHSVCSMSRLAELAHATRQLLPGVRAETQVARLHTANTNSTFNPRMLFLIGGGVTAAVSKIAYDYITADNCGKQVRASETTDREAIRNQFYAEEMARIKKENEVVQLLLDALFKVNHHQQLSDMEVTHIIDNIPLLVSQDEEPTRYNLDRQKFFWGNQFDTLKQHVKNDRTILHSDSACINRYALLRSLIFNMHACGDPTNKKVINAFISKLIGTNNESVAWTINRIFKYIPDAREHIFEEITTPHTDNDSYKYACLIIRNIAWEDIWCNDYCRPKLSLVYMLEFLARQRIGAGTLVTYLLHVDIYTQRLSWLLTRQLMQHPELTPRLATTYNNPAPEFDSFRDFVNQTNISYTKGSPEDEALYAIKREAFRQAKAGALSQE